MRISCSAVHVVIVSGMKYVGSMICTAVNCSQLHDTSATSTVEEGRRRVKGRVREGGGLGSTRRVRGRGEGERKRVKECSRRRERRRRRRETGWMM